MGIAVGDYNLDGRLDIFKTHFSDDTNILYRNDGGANFTDVTFAARLGVETRYTCWGSGMADLDNNGWPDIFVVTGSVYPEVEKKVPAYPYKTPRLVFRNLGNGSFEELIEEAGPGVAAVHCSRGCAFGDFDNDGDVDMLIINLNEPPSLLRNDVQGLNSWIKVKAHRRYIQSKRYRGARTCATMAARCRRRPCLASRVSTRHATPGCISAWAYPKQSIFTSSGPVEGNSRCRMLQPTGWLPSRKAWASSPTPAGHAERHPCANHLYCEAPPPIPVPPVWLALRTASSRAAVCFALSISPIRAYPRAKSV